MKVWNQAPLIRLIIPFLCGIFSAVLFPFDLPVLVPMLCLFFIILSAIVLVPAFYISYRRSYWVGFLINASFFLFAYQLCIYKTDKFSRTHFYKPAEADQIVYARLDNAPVEKEKSMKTVIQVLAVKRGGAWERTSGKALVYFNKDAASLKLAYGDELIMNAHFKETDAPKNPFEFDYKYFLSIHNIGQQAYLKSNEWKNLGSNSGSSILNYSYALRNKLLEILQGNHLTGAEFSVGAALMLGYTDKLDADLLSAYSGSGALHVLSVSGLHVAVVYLVFGWLLFFLNKIQHGPLIKSILLILFLWFYAALTGLSPSVLRAATMFSFVIVAKTVKKHANIYNTLAASALLLLLINPYLIFEVGFQLSYLAVLGIVYVYPLLYDWFEFDNWLLDQVWSITAVSIAAQIATFPLGLHYFNQFPNYFLLSNLIVIPVSTLIIYLGIVVFTFSFIPVFVKYFALAFTGLIWFLNLSVKWIEALPLALTDGIAISWIDVLLFYALIILLFCFFIIRKYKYLLAALSLCVLILCLQIREQFQQLKQRKLVVYAIPKARAIDFITGKSALLLADTVFVKDKGGQAFHLKPNWCELGIDEPRILSNNMESAQLFVQENYIGFYDKKMLLLNENKMKKRKGGKPFHLDYLILSGNAAITIEEIRKVYEAGMIIFDSSNSEFRIKKWKEECEALRQQYYPVMEKGAFVVSF